MKQISHLVAIVTALLASFLGCSGGDGLAGGSGSGNPGGTVTVAMVADTAGASVPAGNGSPLALAKMAIAGGPPTGQPGGRVGIGDSGGLNFVADSISVRVARIRFLLAQGEDCASLLADFAGGGLTCDSGAIVLEGPFTFNAMTGACEPPLDSLQLPEADYVGLRFDIGSGPGSQQCSVECPIRCTGTFLYLDTLRRFSMHLGGRGPMIVRNQGAPTAVSRGFTVDFVTRLSTSTWLDSLDLKGCIDQGSIPLRLDGSLVIEEGIPRGPCMNSAADIGENVEESGRLEVGTRP